MRGWRWDGGRFQPCESAPLSDRGFRYGMSVFESLRVRDGRADFLEEHLVRLRAACAAAEFAAGDLAASQFDGLFRGDGFARIYVTAGDGGPAADAAPRVFVMCEDREPEARAALDLCLSHVTEAQFLSGVKTGNYWPHIAALRKARAGGCGEALLFNARGMLVSGCMANVFLVRDGRIQTPSLGCGARDGVVRAWVLGRREVEERALTPRDAEQADEIFLTNSWIGVMPVASLQGRELPSRAVARTLQRDW